MNGHFGVVGLVWLWLDLCRKHDKWHPKQSGRGLRDYRQFSQTSFVSNVTMQQQLVQYCMLCIVHCWQMWSKLALLTTTFFSRSGLLEWKAQSFDIFPPKTPILWFFYTVELHLWKHCAKSKQDVWHYFIDKWNFFRKICCVCLGLLVTKSPKLLLIEKICG